MRTLPLLVVALVVSACQAPTPVHESWRGAFVDANYGDARRPAAPDLPALDAVSAELMRRAVLGLEYQRRVVLENLANVDTVGFKRGVVRTSTSAITDADGRAFWLPVVIDTERIFTTGTLAVTERSLDLAIDGDGFFSVTLVDGSTGYARSGSLHLDAGCKLVSASGNVLLPEISVPIDTLEISVDPQGHVSGRTAGSPDTSTSFGQITLTRFVNPSAMLDLGDAVLRPTDASGQPITGTPGLTGLGLLKQGCLERSNVLASDELMRLQILERRHQSLVHVLQQFGMVVP